MIPISSERDCDQLKKLLDWIHRLYHHGAATQFATGIQLGYILQTNFISTDLLDVSFDWLSGGETCLLSVYSRLSSKQPHCSENETEVDWKRRKIINVNSDCQ